MRWLLVLACLLMLPACGSDADFGDRDVVPPTVAITAPLDGAAVEADATLAFAASEPAAEFECSFDGGDFAPCGAGSAGAISFPADLGAGAHHAAVRATDLAGLRG